MKRVRIWLTKICWPGLAWCLRCGRPWIDRYDHHATPYTAHKSALPLCEACWAALSPSQRLPYYRELWDIWNASGAWLQWADGSWHLAEPPVSWPLLEDAVLSEEAA